SQRLFGALAQRSALSCYATATISNDGRKVGEGSTHIAQLGGGRIVYMQKTLSVIAWLVAWGWALIAGVGGFLLLVAEGPLPITKGWFAMFSGIAACPLTARLLKRYARVLVPSYVQFAFAL